MQEISVILPSRIQLIGLQPYPPGKLAKRIHLLFKDTVFHKLFELSKMLLRVFSRKTCQNFEVVRDERSSVISFRDRSHSKTNRPDCAASSNFFPVQL